MWRRKLRRAFDGTGARAPGAVIGWNVVVLLLLFIPATQLGLYSLGDRSEGEVEGTLARDELTLGPTATSPSDVATTTAGPESTRTAVAPDQDVTGPTVPAQTPDPSVIPTTGPATTTTSASQSTTASTTTSGASTTARPTRGEPTSTGPTSTGPTTGGATTATPTTTAPTTTGVSTTARPASSGPTSSGPTTAAPTTATTSTFTPNTTPTTARPTAPSTTRPPNPNFAVGDSYQLESGKNGNLRVLSNDGDQALLDRNTLEIIVAPSFAAKFGVRGNHIHYQSDADYAGSDSLRYRICTVDGACAVATVAIQVTAG